MKVHSGDADIYYDVLGDGPDLVLLHAFPTNHNLWRPVAERFAVRYRVVLMDLRGHGDSGVGDGPATMEKHAADVARVCDDASVGKAIFGGVSIGGYVLMEFWRRCRERVAALVLADTKAQADTEEGRAARLKSAEDVERNGPDAFLDGLLPRAVGETTRRARPDLFEATREMARKMTVAGIAAVQRGMAARPDSVPTLATITVPTLLLFGAEDGLTTVADGELMCDHIRGSRLEVIPKAGHFAVFEQQDSAHELIRKFLDSHRTDG
ncbi:MAG: alpha/beta fold hydrolase [Terriglobales bacterium]